jgi:FkbM family methyltransferase
MKKLKSALFKFLNRVRGCLSGTGISKIPGVSKAYDFLFQHLWPHQDVVEVQGSKMYLNVRDKNPEIRKTFQAYALNRIHEKATTNLFKKVIKEGDIVVDLGANIGYFTLLAAKLVGKKGKVYAFEPEPRNYNYLIKNAELNSYNNVFTIQKAVSDKNARTKLFLCPYDTGHHTINQYEGIRDYKPEFLTKEEKFIEIETITLDDFLKDKEQSIDVIKIDVEGAEMLALSGMEETIKQSKNLKMFVEFFPLLIRKMGHSPEEFVSRLLENYGFSIFIIGQDYNASNKELLRINSADELMTFCKGEKDHLNLFVKKEN